MSNESMVGVIIMLLLSIFGVTVINSGHKRHKRLMEKVGWNESNGLSFDELNKNGAGFFDWNLLIILLLLCLALGMLNAAYQYKIYLSKLFVFEGFLINVLFYWWYYKDKLYRGYRAAKVLNVAVILMPLLSLPVYLFKSRSSVQAQQAFAVFLAIVTYAHNLMFVGVIIFDKFKLLT